MKEKRMLLVVAVVLIVLLGGAYALYGTLSSQVEEEKLAVQEPESSADASQEEKQRVAALDFTVEDGDGQSHQLSDYFGKPLVLNFWASWCGPCRKEMPDFDAVYQELGGEVEFLMVNVTDGSRETLESAKAFAAEQDYALPLFYDTNLEASMAYGVQGLPTTFFIDGEGYVVAWGSGVMSRDTLEKGIEMARTGGKG